jgi:hypothetical protein
MGDAEQTLEHRQEAADRLRIERLADPRWPCPSPVTGGVGSRFGGIELRSARYAATDQQPIRCGQTELIMARR